MRTKRAVEPDTAATSTAVRRLLSELSIEELEPIAVEVIREHRHGLQRAQDLFDALEHNDENRAASEELVRLRQDYLMAMLNLHGKHQLVSLIVAALGYVPDVDGQSPNDSTPH
ncbi:MAG: transcriptional repressor TraM [Devosia sp.]